MTAYHCAEETHQGMAGSFERKRRQPCQCGCSSEEGQYEEEKKK
jgi:hypothetical protein